MSQIETRQTTSISDDWQTAEIVCLGTVRRKDEHSATFRVSSILKGTQTVGAVIEIPNQKQLAGIFPTDTDEKESAVFFGREESDELVAKEIYSDLDKIAAIECLAGILAEPEREKLQALRDLVLSPSSRCNASFRRDARALFRTELMSAISQMRDRNNFDIIMDLYKTADANTRRELLEWMACTGDRRALPFLIDAVDSMDTTLRTTAITRLTFYFPGDTGVLACVQEAYEQGFADTRNVAFDYLKRRGKIKVAKAESKQSNARQSYNRAEEMYARGECKSAVAYYLQEITSDTADHYVRRWSALKAIPFASSEEKLRIKNSIMPIVAGDAATGNYLEASDAGMILQKLEDDECIDSLIHLLDRRDTIFSRANRAAAFGIAHLSTEARKKATLHLFTIMRNENFPVDLHQRQLTTLLDLAWIGRSEDYSEAQRLLHGTTAAPVLVSIQPLFAANDKSRDTSFLIETLQNNPNLPLLAKDWIIAQLGELRAQEAVGAIIQNLKNLRNQHDVFASEEALKQIGSPQTNELLAEVALSEEESSKNAVDILCELEAEKCLPILRKVVIAKSTATQHALSAMAKYGTEEDLKILLPMSDFWTGERTCHYWIMEAIATIRQRLALDVATEPTAQACDKDT
ncbi:MAG TPA: hypothetical protein V6C76_09360 [Drouetiella sp.]